MLSKEASGPRAKGHMSVILLRLTYRVVVCQFTEQEVAVSTKRRPERHGWLDEADRISGEFADEPSG